jgi:hypothetical protein
MDTSKRGSHEDISLQRDCGKVWLQSKVLYYEGVRVRDLEQVAVGIKVGNNLWVTGHYELHARVEVIAGGRGL